MTPETKRHFTVIENENYNDTEQEYRHNRVTPPDIGYSTNPMYEKLLKYQELQKKKRFTVDDLLKW